MASQLSRNFAVCGRIFVDICRQRHPIPLSSRAAVTGYPQADKALDTLSGGKIEGWLRTYENMVGLTEVREAQDKVIQAEQQFLLTQEDRRARQKQVSDVHGKLKEIHAQLDKVQRGDARYLALLTEEYEIIKDEKTIQSDLSHFEQMERERFAFLSSAVRESQEKERNRTERTKYWSIIGSVIGAMIGIIGTSLNNYLRMRELRGIVKDSAAGGIELKGLVSQLSGTMKNQHHQMHVFVNDLKSLLGTAGPGALLSASGKDTTEKEPPSLAQDSEQLETRTKEILDSIRKQDEHLEKEMRDIRKILATSMAAGIEGNVIYVGPEMETMLGKTESNLEWKIKMNSLWTVTFIYGAFALTIPVLYSLFKGS